MKICLSMLYLHSPGMRQSKIWKLLLRIHLTAWLYLKLKPQTERSGEGTYVDWHQIKYCLHFCKVKLLRFTQLLSDWLIVDILSDFPKQGSKIICGDKYWKSVVWKQSHKGFFCVLHKHFTFMLLALVIIFFFYIACG